MLKFYYIFRNSDNTLTTFNLEKMLTEGEEKEEEEEAVLWKCIS